MEERIMLLNNVHNEDLRCQASPRMERKVGTVTENRTFIAYGSIQRGQKVREYLKKYGKQWLKCFWQTKSWYENWPSLYVKKHDD